MTSLCLVGDLGYRIARSLEDDAPLPFYILSLSGSETPLVGTDLGLPFAEWEAPAPYLCDRQEKVGCAEAAKGLQACEIFQGLIKFNSSDSFSECEQLSPQRRAPSLVHWWESSGSLWRSFALHPVGSFSQHWGILTTAMAWKHECLSYGGEG